VTATTPLAAATPVTAARVTLGGVIRSEWIKLRSVRSTLLLLALTVVFMAGFPLLLPTRPSYNPIDQSLFGVHFASLTVGVLGVLAITAEYGTGLITATFAAVPRRLPVLGAKAAVLASTVFLVTFAAGLLALEIGQARYGGATLGSPGALRAVAGAALFLTLTGLLGLGFGFLARNTAGGVTAAVAFTFLIPQIGDLLPSSWQPRVVPYLPFQAGEALYTVQPFPAFANELLGPWAAAGVLCGYAAVTVTAAAAVLRRRDATASYGWRERLRERRGAAAGPPAPGPLPRAPSLWR
jgi:ABC-2 type transport system permease protein